MTKLYEVIVGNIGTVYSGPDQDKLQTSKEAQMEKQKVSDAQYIAKAQELWYSDGEIEIDENAKVSWGNDGGAYLAHLNSMRISSFAEVL